MKKAGKRKKKQRSSKDRIKGSSKDLWRGQKILVCVREHIVNNMAGRHKTVCGPAMVLLCVTYIAAPVMFSAITKGPATRYTRPTSDSFAYFTQQEKERSDQRVRCLDIYPKDTIAVLSSSNSLFWLGKKREAKSEHTLDADHTSHQDRACRSQNLTVSAERKLAIL